MSQEKDNVMDLDSNDDCEKNEPCNVKDVKRRRTKKRSVVWDHFTAFKNEKGEQKSICNYCGKEYFLGSKSHGTSTLRNHLNGCIQFSKNTEDGQTRIAFQIGAGGVKVEERKLVAWKFDQEEVRKAVAEMIVIDELPLKFVERRGFNRLMKVAQPLFRMPCRSTVGRDYLGAFEDEKKRIRALLLKNIGRICLTTERINYMCLTAHYVDNDWNLRKRLINFCPISYFLTFLDDITSIFVILKKCLNEKDDIGLQKMAKLMKEKFDKYYGSIEKFNILVYAASVLDPINKLAYMEILLSEVYGKVDGGAILHIVQDEIEEIFEDYVRIHSSNNPPAEASDQASSGKRSTPADADFGMFNKENFRMKMKMKMGNNGIRDTKSELEKYLGEEVEDESPGIKFDILNWWKVNSPRFPILSLLARDVFAIPISTVASESVFSTSGRVLDQYRSSLTPDMVECLLCTEDWFNGRLLDAGDFEEDWEDIQAIQEDFYRLRV